MTRDKQSYKVGGLPGEEYVRLKGRQELARVYDGLLPFIYNGGEYESNSDVNPVEQKLAQKNLGHRSEVDYTRPFQSVETIGDSTENPRHQNDRKLYRSELAVATRKALGSRNYPNSTFLCSSERKECSTPQLSYDWTIVAEPIEKNSGLQDFHTKWYEDDEDSDADQLLADMTPNGLWRKHAPITPLYELLDGVRFTSMIPGYEKSTFSRNPPKKPVLMRPDMGGTEPNLARPALLPSKFSWSTASTDANEAVNSRTTTKERCKKSFRKSFGSICYKT